jgi:2,4-dienoyl-CoA reductase-like NADH-dependent reductase (Old Yellow Enzyme family)
VGPNSLSVADILAIEGQFADAARRCIAAGFDGVELHGAHGFLLDSFLSTERNARSDDYGGAIGGRMRLLVETCSLVRARIAEDALLGCRISVFNHLAEGFAPGDLESLVQGIEGAGTDLLHLSVMEGAALDGYFGSDKTLGQWARASTCLPIIVAGRLGNPRDAERAVAEGHADFAAVGSAMLEEVEWTQYAREVLDGEGEVTS